jgi:uncharacterized protein YgiM (DUF1202 family)
MKAVVLFTLLLINSCGPRPEPILDQATVVAKNASLRMRNSSTSRTLRVLDTGDKVVVLERQENWYRVRFGDDVEGWMEESTVVTNATRNRIQGLVSESEGQSRRTPLFERKSIFESIRAQHRSSGNSSQGRRWKSSIA